METRFTIQKAAGLGKTLYLIAGPSGSGKSYFAKQLMNEKGIKFNFEADHWMKDKFGIYHFDPKNLNYCHKRCQTYTENAMKTGHDVIVSNTSLIKREAKPYIDLAKKYGYSVEIHHMTGRFQNKHGVPDWKVEEMRNKHEFYSLEDFR
jgi:predicted kinase